MENYHDERDNQDEVDKPSGNVESQPEKPADDEDDSDDGEHDVSEVEDVHPLIARRRAAGLISFCFANDDSFHPSISCGAAMSGYEPTTC